MQFKVFGHFPVLSLKWDFYCIKFLCTKMHPKCIALVIFDIWILKLSVSLCNSNFSATFKSGVRFLVFPVINLCTKLHQKCTARSNLKCRWFSAIQNLPPRSNFPGFESGCAIVTVSSLYSIMQKMHQKCITCVDLKMSVVFRNSKSPATFDFESSCAMLLYPHIIQLCTKCIKSA